MRNLLFLSLLITAILVKANEVNIDSLKNLVSINSEEEENIIRAVEKAKDLIYINSDTSIILLEKELQKAIDIGYEAGISWAYDRITHYYIYIQDYNKAIEYYKKQIPYHKKNNKYIELARIYNGIGINNQYLGYFDSAINYHEMAIFYSKKIENKKRIAKSYNNIAVIYAYRGDYYKALDYFLLSLKMKENSNDTASLIDSYSNIAVMYQQVKDYDNALKYHRIALKLNKSFQNKPRFSLTYNNIASVYKRKELYDSALYYHKKSLQIKKELHDKKGISTSYHNIGDIYIQQEKYDSAIVYLRNSLKIKEEIGHKRGIGLNYLAIGSYYYEIYKNDSAKYYLQKAFKNGSELELLTTIQGSAELLHKIYSNEKDFKTAYFYLDKYTTITDSLLNEEKINEIAQLEAKYEKEKLEFEHQAELKKQRIWRNILIISAIALIVFILFLIKYLSDRNKANKIIQRKNKQITDSINYAKHIQDAMLPTGELIRNTFNDSFIFYMPKDIVSGDFYWFKKQNDKLFLAVADCTGHGVPGALLSMLGMSFLNDIINENPNLMANAVLEELRNRIILSLKQTGKNNEAKDGIDMAFGIFDIKSLSFQFAGANNPMIIIREKEIIELKADFMPVGIYFTENKLFTLNEVQLQKDDQLYMFSDGFYDQIGGPENRKFQSTNFKNLLLENASKSFSDQKNILKETFINWKASQDQIDDILIVGLKI